MVEKVGYLGPAGTYSHQAAGEFYGKGKVDLVPCFSLSAVFEKFKDGLIQRGVVPLENSLEDAVGPVIDALIGMMRGRFGENVVTGELVLPIHHVLAGKIGTRLAAIKVVISHPQPLGQCSRFLAAGWEVQQSSSTAAAAERVAKMSGDNAACITSRWAAELYGLTVLRTDIADSDHNETRFIVLGGSPPRRTVRDKTMVLFSTADQPGALVEVLKVFAECRINLSKIQSRTAGTRIGKCVFWIDAQAHQHAPRMKKALALLQAAPGPKEVLRDVWIAGSYPQCVQR